MSNELINLNNDEHKTEETTFYLRKLNSLATPLQDPAYKCFHWAGSKDEYHNQLVMLGKYLNKSTKLMMQCNQLLYKFVMYNTMVWKNDSKHVQRLRQACWRYIGTRLHNIVKREHVRRLQNVTLLHLPFVCSLVWPVTPSGKHIFKFKMSFGHEDHKTTLYYGMMDVVKTIWGIESLLRDLYVMIAQAQEQWKKWLVTWWLTEAYSLFCMQLMTDIKEILQKRK